MEKWNKTLYRIYQNMLQRCKNPNHSTWHYYGGRGISVCERWIGSKRGEGFANFLADLGDRPEGFTLERINTNGNYEPSNCCWASRKDQYRNRRSNVFIQWNGESKILKDWETETGIRSDVISRRLEKGLPLDLALTMKSMKSHKSSETIKIAIEAAAEARRSRTHCKRGHEFTTENTYTHNGTRTCRRCKRESMAAKRALQK